MCMVFVVMKLHSIWYTTLFIKKLTVPGTKYDAHISSSTCYIKQGVTYCNFDICVYSFSVKTVPSADMQ